MKRVGQGVHIPVKFGTVPVVSFKDPSLQDASEGHLELLKDALWIARTAVKIPTLKTETDGRETPKLSVKMKYLEASGPTREEAIAKLRQEVLWVTDRIPELRAEDVDV